MNHKEDLLRSLWVYNSIFVSLGAPDLGSIEGPQ